MPAETTSPTDAEQMLLDFVRGRDVECPRCGYNLRDLSKPTCPECEQTLELRVGAERIEIIWFVLAIAPCIFSGMVAPLLSWAIITDIASGGTGPPWPFYVVNAFNWTSAAGAIALLILRRRFLRIRRVQTQVLWVLGLWAAHFIAFMLFMSQVI